MKRIFFGFFFNYCHLQSFESKSCGKKHFPSTSINHCTKHIILLARLLFFFVAIISCNIIILLLVLTLTILQQKKKKKQSRMPISSCQTFTKRQNSFEEKEVQFNCKAYFLFFCSIPCVMMVIEHICSHCWLSFFMLLYTLVDCYQHPSTFPSFFTFTG